MLPSSICISSVCILTPSVYVFSELLDDSSLDPDCWMNAFAFLGSLPQHLHKLGCVSCKLDDYKE